MENYIKLFAATGIKINKVIETQEFSQAQAKEIEDAMTRLGELWESEEIDYSPLALSFNFSELEQIWNDEILGELEPTEPAIQISSYLPLTA